MDNLACDCLVLSWPSFLDLKILLQAFTIDINRTIDLAPKVLTLLHDRSHRRQIRNWHTLHPLVKCYVERLIKAKVKS